MTVNVVCTRNTPALPGAPNNAPLVIPELLQAVLRETPALPEALPLFISDFPINRISTLYWLSILNRATYSPTAALFRQAAYAVAPSSATVTFTPNTGGLTPGFGIIKFPQFMVVVISGTSNISQWVSQVFLNQMVPTDYPVAGGSDTGQVMSIYKTSADTIAAAIMAAAGDDRPVLLCGHSMGGAVALTLHYKYRRETPERRPSRCVTFGNPKPGDETVANGMRNSAVVLRRLVIAGDPVPSLPPALPKAAILVIPAPFVATVNTWSTYAQPGSPYYVDSAGNQAVGSEPSLPLFVAGAIVTIGAGRAIALPRQHMLVEFAARFRANFGSALPTNETRRWQNPGQLDVINDLCSAVGLP